MTITYVYEEHDCSSLEYGILFRHGKRSFAEGKDLRKIEGTISEDLIQALAL